MQESCLVLTDSGGVQEECCALGKQALVMREVTERREAIDSGWAKLVGCDEERIVKACFEVLTKPAAPVVNTRNPFGDGRAAQRIVAALWPLKRGCANSGSSA